MQKRHISRNLHSGRALLLAVMLFSAGAAAADEPPAPPVDTPSNEAPSNEETAATTPAKLTAGPVTVRGALRVNYAKGSYTEDGASPDRGDSLGSVDWETIILGISFRHESLIGEFEYRWYDGYNMLHTAWLGYEFADGGRVQAGMTRVPFGPGAYGVSQSWFFDQHFYLGLADDSDLGIRYQTSRGNWQLDLGYFYSSEGSFNGDSDDSARYGYDFVTWTESIAPDGDVSFGGTVSGYEERNQFNGRAIYRFGELPVVTDLGVSLQYGQLDGEATDDGSHWAASAHMVNNWGPWLLSSQLTRYVIDIDANNPWNTDEFLPMGAFDFAWPVASAAWIPAASLSYLYEASGLGWLDSVRPYIEYSNIIADESDFNDSHLVTLGAAWSSGRWYIFSDLAYSTGNFFVGDDGDDFSNIFDGVGDTGVTGNDKWNYRFNINFGWYF